MYVGRGRFSTVGPTEYVGADDVITIPDGFQTDLASVPRLFWALLPPNGVYERSAVLHDFGCVSLLRGDCRLSSRDVDGLFRRVVREEQELDKFRPWRRQAKDFVVRWVLWWGVRLGALGNEHRRPGWWRDAPLVALITVLAAGTTAAAVYGLDHAAHAVARLITT